MLRIEHTIFKNLVRSSQYLKDAYPHLKSEYFTDKIDLTLFNKLSEYIDKYSTNPTEETLKIQIDKDKHIDEGTQDDLYEVLDAILEDTTETPFKWLVEQTEVFCKERAIYNAMVKSLKIAEGESEESEHIIPDILKAALAVSFTTQIGMDYLGDAESRFESYHTTEDKVESHLQWLNFITKGGAPRKTLNAILSGTGVGKSTVMCDLAAGYLELGYNVLYITAEMSEKRIAERIDANLLDVPITDLFNLKRDTFLSKISKIKGKTNGKLFIKEYPTGASHVGHYRQLIAELAIKKDFIPDVILIDYLGIIASSRIKMGGSTNSYSYLKAVAEEVRGLMVETNCVGWTAMQLNRGGIGNSDVNMTDTADSMAVVHTLDLFFALMTDEEQEANGTMTIKQLKNRYAGITGDTLRFHIGIVREKMRLTDLDGGIKYTSKVHRNEKDIDHGVSPWEESAEEQEFSLDKKKTKSFEGFDFSQLE